MLRRIGGCHCSFSPTTERLSLLLSCRQLLEEFSKCALLDSSYFLCRQDSVTAAAALLEHLPLALPDAYNFSCAPASATDPRLAAALLHFASKYAGGTPCTLDIHIPNAVPANIDELRHLESAHQVVALWLWLSYRFHEGAFPERQHVENMALAICDLLDKGMCACWGWGWGWGWSWGWGWGWGRSGAKSRWRGPMGELNF
jgi:hypothetical protein